MMFRTMATISCVLALWLIADRAIANDDLVNNAGAAPTEVQKARRNDKGLYELVSPRLSLVTDIPIDEELERWPGLIEQSIEHWKSYFGMDTTKAQNLRLSALLIGDRERLTQLGMLDNVPSFDEGYQFGNKIYMREQPTAYYRRHLFLHEATHWIIWELTGGGGPPWFMEGMAEMQGTHSLKDGRLTLGVLPSSSELFSGWGRLRKIDETLKRGVAPSLSEILSYGNAREDHEIRYSWSWAACVFFTHHPKCGPILKELYSKKLDYSDSLTQHFKKRLAADWNSVQVDWNAFVSDLDFGYDVDRSMLVSNANPSAKDLSQGVSARIQLATDRGWQATGVLVNSGNPIRISCTGEYSIGKTKDQNNVSLSLQPNGITYQYYRGNPLGCVIASVVSPNEMDLTRRWETIRVGQQSVLAPVKTGELFLKVNGPSGGLAGNVGSISVDISVADQ